MAQPQQAGNKQDKTEEVDKQVLKRYEITQRLGKGAYGIVWKVKSGFLVVFCVYWVSRPQIDYANKLLLSRRYSMLFKTLLMHNALIVK